MKETELKRYITKYYKGLFGKPEQNSIVLDESMIKYIPKVLETKNEILTSSFTTDEVRKVVFEMEHNKVPGPDWFPAEFYQVFWEVTKEE